MITEAGNRGLRSQQRAFADRPDSRPDLRNIACPTLVLCGRDNVITPLEMSEEIAEEIPGAELAVLETCGHIPMLEWPEQTTDLLWHWLERIRA